MITIAKAKSSVMFLFFLSREQTVTQSLEHPEGYIKEKQQHPNDGGPDIHIVQLIPARREISAFES